MLGSEEPKALGPLLGIEEVVDRMDGDAEGMEAENEYKTEGYGLSGPPRDPTEPERGNEEERSQEQTRSRAMMRDRLGRRDVYNSGKLRG
jgi:hypothetical protein